MQMRVRAQARARACVSAHRHACKRLRACKRAQPPVHPHTHAKSPRVPAASERAPAPPIPRASAPNRARPPKATRVSVASVPARRRPAGGEPEKGGRGGGPGLGRGRQREEEEGSAAQTVRRQQTPANSSGHTMANTGGEPRPPSAQPIASDSRSCQEASEPAWPATGTAAGGRLAFTPPSPPWGYFLACLIFLHPCNVVGKIRAKPGLFGWGGGGAFLALRLPRKVNPSPGRATASIFSCVFSLFLSFFFF